MLIFVKAIDFDELVTCLRDLKAGYYQFKPFAATFKSDTSLGNVPRSLCIPLNNISV
jgi:hypothetical protein